MVFKVSDESHHKNNYAIFLVVYKYLLTQGCCILCTMGRAEVNCSGGTTKFSGLADH